MARRNVKAANDGVAVANLRSAGGIPLLVSTTPEYCQSWETNNLVTGKTLNPHDLRRTPGGSSGGEVSLRVGQFFPTMLNEIHSRAL